MPIRARPERIRRTRKYSWPSHAFDDRCHSLAGADAPRASRVLAAILLELARCGEQQPRTGHAKRMTNCDRATVGIHARVVIGDAELAKTGERLRCEGFVELDDGYVLERQPRLRQSHARR